MGSKVKQCGEMRGNSVSAEDKTHGTSADDLADDRKRREEARMEGTKFVQRVKRRTIDD